MEPEGSLPCSQELVPILSHMYPVHTLPPYFFKIHSNIIHLAMPRSSEWSLPIRFSYQNLLYVSHLPYVCYM